MADKITARQRSANMRAVRSKDTAPEMLVRRAAHALGLRFRLYRRDLPGCPDLVFAKWRTVIFVNGCFWHGHPGCRKSKMPASNVEFWRAKLENNIRRDAENHRRLREMGWNVAVLWACGLKAKSDAVAAVGAIDALAGALDAKKEPFGSAKSDVAE